MEKKPSAQKETSKRKASAKKKVSKRKVPGKSSKAKSMKTIKPKTASRASTRKKPKSTKQSNLGLLDNDERRKDENAEQLLAPDGIFDTGNADLDQLKKEPEKKTVSEVESAAEAPATHPSSSATLPQLHDKVTNIEEESQPWGFLPNDESAENNDESATQGQTITLHSIMAKLQMSEQTYQQKMERIRETSENDKKTKCKRSRDEVYYLSGKLYSYRSFRHLFHIRKGLSACAFYKYSNLCKNGWSKCYTIQIQNLTVVQYNIQTTNSDLAYFNPYGCHI